MAEGLPTPRSREQILSEMLTEYRGLTGIDDLNTGSVVTQFFDVVARSVARTSGDIFQILRDFSLDRAVGEALNRIGDEERVPRQPAQIASGTVSVLDTTFEKIETKIYAGSPSPNIGSSVIRVSDASEFTATGTLYIGRGTPNVEGPISYNTVTQVGSFWEITLDTPTKKFHNISESVILGQGGTRTIPVDTVVLSPGAGATADILYNVSSAAILLDGENRNDFVQVVAQEPGDFANAPRGSIREFSTEPFPGASVINEIPISNGEKEESDDNYRDRIKKARLSRGLGTALAVRNAVLGAQAQDEDARVTSNEIDTTNPEQTILYIDNGEGYEEKSSGVGIEPIIDSAIGGEQNFQLETGGSQTSVRKAFLESSLSTPFSINSFDKLSILVGGILSEHTFLSGAFRAEGAATAYEVVASINDNPDLTFEATTAENGTKVVLQAKAEDNEFLQITSPSVGNDSAPSFGFTSNEVSTVLLYKNRELLNKNGRSAFVISKERFDWSSTITDGETLTVSVDGTNAITYTFQDEDFIAEGQHPTVSANNTLSSWINVINAKVTGVTAEANGEQIKLTSNLGAVNRAAISIDPLSTLVIKGMFSSDLGLSATGNEADFELSRNTAQIKLNQPLTEGDSLTLGSEFTRAEVRSSNILGGSLTLTDTAYLWIVVDNKNVESIQTGLAADTFLEVSKPGGGIIRYTSSSTNAFGNVQVGDYVIVWSEELSAANRLEARVNAVTATTLDIKVTASEESSAVAEGPLLFQEGFTVVRTEIAPQKIKVDPGVYDINTIADDINLQVKNAVFSIDEDEIFVIRTKTESVDGSLFVVDSNEAGKSLNFTKSDSSDSINSQIAFNESSFSDKQFPLFVHGTINTDAFADPPNSNITSIDSSEDLAALGLDPSGYICFSQPYNGQNDIISEECIEIERFIGTAINVENSPIYKRSRVGDRYHVLGGYDFSHNDFLVIVLDNDATGKTFDIPVFRTALVNNTHPNNPDNFRAYDSEGGPTTEFTEFFGDEFLFDNYKALMQAKNGLDPLSLTDEDAILYRSTEWGRSGESFGVGYKYPTASDQDITHIVTFGETVNIDIFLKSGPARVTTIDGTTEWNVSISPLSPSVDLVTYTYSGTGTAPGLASLNSGDYVTIRTTGEFSQENTGTYRVDSSTANSFTIRRANGDAVAETDIATVETNTFSIYESSSTTAQEIVDYVTSDVSDYLTATILDDNGSSGAGVIDRSTAEDSDFSYERVFLKDGKNYILSTDLDALVGNPQFTFKNSLTLPSFSTNTVDAYTFNDGEQIRIVPTTSLHLSEFFNILAVTGFTTIGEIKSVRRNSTLQFSSDITGSEGSVQVAGDTASAAIATIDGSAVVVGSQSNQKSIVTILTSASTGFHSDQYVKVSASEIQKKNIGIDETNSIRVTQATPAVGFSKIELFDRQLTQDLFGRNRYHTRTRGRTFRVEKQGELTCISWDGNGTEPFFLVNSIDVKDSSASTLTINTDSVLGTADISVDTGDMRFDGINKGDLITLSNRLNSVNNGTFIVLGKSDDGKTLRILNQDAVNELATGSFTITDNVAVVGSTFTVGANTVTEGVEFSVGATLDDTASNLAAAISLLPNVSSQSNAAIANIESDIPGVTVALSVSGGGATASGSQLEAPTSSTGDLTATTEVQEGDSVIIASDFNILNQGTYRVIRRFKNSIYIDNPNSVDEEVTLADQLISTGANASTDYDVEKDGSTTKLKWAGSGTEPSLESMRPGDIITLGADFSADNQGEFHIIDSGEKLQEITRMTQSRAVDMSTGQYALINSEEDATEYYIWYNKDGGGGDPSIPGKTGIEIPVTTGESASDVAITKAGVINTTFSTDFSAVASGDDVIITNVGFGETTNASNVDVAGDFDVEVTQEGRRNFVSYINVDAVNESGITISDVLEFHREAMKFKSYDGIIPGDVAVISSNFLGEDNAGRYTVSDVLSETEIIVTGNASSTTKQLLDTNFSNFYVEEENPYVGYKKIDVIATNPANLNAKNILFDTANQSSKINELAGVSISALGKLNLSSDVIKGIDSYKYNTGLIAEANRIVYGEPRDSTTYPGVGAAGAEIFIKAPLVRRIQVSIDVRVKTGVPFSTISEEIRNSVTALINSNDVGQPIPISNIVSNVNAIVGVQSVAISSPQYDANNDVIRVNSGEKALVLDTIADVIVSKIE